MATKPRHQKTAMQLWVADSRKAGRTGDGSAPYTSADLARWTGVTVDTARGWESRGSPSEDAIRELELRFGTPAPRGTGGAVGQDALVAALAAQTEALTALANQVKALIEAQMSPAELAHAMGEAVALAVREALQAAARGDVTLRS